MADRASRVWGYRLLFVFLAAAVSFVQLLPLDPGPGVIPGPDVLLLIALSWVVMRPDYLPVWLIAVVFLTADFLHMRAPGLWTALAVAGTEFLRTRSLALRTTSFPVEWLLVSGLIVAMTLLNAVILGLFAVGQPAIGLILMRMIFTVLCYPLIVVLAGRAFGVRKAPVSDILGQRA